MMEMDEDGLDGPRPVQLVHPFLTLWRANAIWTELEFH